MNILMATSECTPFIKTGGLADVLGSLPQALIENGNQCTVVLPLYRDIKNRDQLEYVTSYDIFLGWHKKYCGVFTTQIDNVRYYFIDNEEYFNRPGLYSYDDDYERFGYFDYAVLELISHLQLDIDVLHCHDWQAAMIIPLYYEKYMHHPYYKDIKTVFTIHNIAYQGKADPRLIDTVFGLPYELYFNGNLRNDDCFNMMKAAITYSNYITTVSPTYAKEIMTNEYGEGLQYILQMRSHDVYGIVNGIDYIINNPETDPNIIANFSIKDMSNKAVAKKALQKELGLECKDVPLIGIVTRLTWQKGVDLILNQMDELLSSDVQVVLLGAGDYQYEEAFSYFASKYPKTLALRLQYDFGLSCRIYSACDMFLMPSLFEPCGLSQMMSMRYGTLPIVRETGGLKDTVIAYDKETGKGTGFSFRNYNAHEMMDTIRHAVDVYNEKEVWQSLVKQAMETKMDWEKSAKAYLDIYTK